MMRRRVRDEFLSEKKGVVQEHSRAGLTAVLCWGIEREKRLRAAQIGEEEINGKCWERE